MGLVAAADIVIAADNALFGFTETKLGIVPAVEPVSEPPLRGFRATGRWFYRRALFTVLFLVWFGFIAKVYVGEFLHYHPYVGLLNHPLIQVPCCNYIPAHLAEAAKR